MGEVLIFTLYHSVLLTFLNHKHGFLKNMLKVEKLFLCEGDIENGISLKRGYKSLSRNLW